MTLPRTRPIALASLLAIVAGLGPSAAAQTTSRVSGEGAVVTLHAEAPSRDGHVRAALTIDLEPGWKTYWLDPGQSGIPPTLTVSPPYRLEDMRLPAPTRFGEGVERANGFHDATALALTLAAPSGGGPEPVEIAVMLGICRDICVPVSATLRALPGAASNGSVNAAFAALPALDASAEHILSATLDRGARQLDVTIEDEGSGNAAIFVSGPSGWYFGEPGPPDIADRRAHYRVPITGMPRGTPGAPALTIVVGTSKDAVERRLTPMEAGK